MTLFNILNLRFNWERLTSKYKMDVDNTGTINNLEWFIKNGSVNNRFRPGFDEALNIANTILGEVHGRESSTS